MSNLRVLIVDDQEIIRSGLRRLLELAPDIEVVGEAESAESAIEAIPSLQPDVVLLDIKLPGMDGISALKVLRKQFPQVKVLMLTAYADGHISSALANGAQGYLLKNVSGAELVNAVRAAARGESSIHVSSEDLSHLVSDLSPKHEPALSARQLEILRLVAQGLSNVAIGEKLFVSERTVKRDLSDVFQKLRVNSRAEAVAYAYEHGLI